MDSLETPPFVGHFSGLVADYPKLVGHSMKIVGRFEDFVGDIPVCWTLFEIGCRLSEDGCSSIIGGDSFNKIYATILKKVNFRGTALQ
ncbi:hypothetical protein HDC33_000463 [Sporosarcina sp. JAI121]|nr:hypothetical protein [Sporosarcina sp. JAI121]